MKILLLSLFISSINACLVVRPKNDTVIVPNCNCPPIKLLNQVDVRKNIDGKYLGNQKTWAPTIGFNLPVQCEFNVLCPAVPGVSSFYTIMFRKNGNPIYINRVIDSESTFFEQPRFIGDFKCGQDTDGSYKWFFHDFPLTDVSFSCQADVDSCKCPEITVDPTNGTEVTTRYPSAQDQCSLYFAGCREHSDTIVRNKFPFLYSKDSTINSGAVSRTFYEDLMCIKEDDNSYNWYFLNEKLENVSIGCNTVFNEFGSREVCICGAFPIINTEEQLTSYDKNNDYDGAILGVNSWTPGCDFEMKCEDGFIGVVFSSNYKPIELNGNKITCSYNPMRSDLRIWVVNGVRVLNPAGGCLKKSLISVPNCLCPPLKLLDQEGVQANTHGKYLRYRQTWFPTIGFNLANPCEFNVFCPAIPGVSSFYTVMFRKSMGPIYINRVVNNQSTFRDQPRYIGDFKCGQDTDGSYKWFFHDFPLTDVSFACQADVDNCKCPRISGDPKSNLILSERYPNAPNQCSLLYAYCDHYKNMERRPFLYSTEYTIGSGGPLDGFYDDLICIEGYDGTFDWYFSNLKLENVTIGCNTALNEFGSDDICYCGAFTYIDTPQKLIQFDRNADYDGAIIGNQDWSPQCEFGITCEEGYLGVVFSANADPIELNGHSITCAYNPLSNDLRMWVVNGVRVINPAGACLKRTYIHVPKCLCPPIRLLDQDGVRMNSEGSYLRNRQTWFPEIGFTDSCEFNVFCPNVPGVSSFYTILFRNEGNPIYINRVVNNISTFRDQPRYIGDFKCDQDTDGSYQWFFHDSPVYGLSFGCQADVDSCKCPEIKADLSGGDTIEERYPSAPDQCALYLVRCENQYLGDQALLYSTDSTIVSGSIFWRDFYEDLICVKEDDNSFHWYFSNQRLQNVSIRCNNVQEEFKSPPVCYCGTFPSIDTNEKLALYDKDHDYDGAIIGVNSWTPGCDFEMKCEDGFVGVVFSSNYDPIELINNRIKCTYNPLTNDLRMWVVDGIRVLNPAGSCLKNK